MILASGIITYNKYFVLRDYDIQIEADCDPTLEKCFVYECDPTTEECSENPEENISYYKLITKKAYLFPDCDPNDENCPQPDCLPTEDCTVTLCDETTVGEGGTCNDPEEYLQNNPPEEEEAAEEGDEATEECDPEQQACEEVESTEAEEPCDPAAEDCQEDTNATTESQATEAPVAEPTEGTAPAAPAQ